MDYRKGLRAIGWGVLMMLIGAQPALKEYAASLPGWVMPLAALAALFGAGAVAYLSPPKER